MNSNDCNKLFIRETSPSRGNYIWVREPKSYGKLDDYFKSAYLDEWKPNTFSGVIKLILTTLQPIHIGSGRIVKRGRELVQEFYNHDGTPVIPGSSLKGVIRHHLTTLVGEKNANALFGSTDHASLVYFSDAIPQVNTVTRTIEIAERWGPRIKREDSVKYYQTIPRSSQSRKERIEIVPENIEFNFTLSFRNLKEVHLGALFIAMGLDPDKPRGFKLGGGKGYGLGLVKLDIDLSNSWFIRDARQLLSPQKRIPFTKDAYRKWVKLFWNSLNKELKEHLECLEKEFSREYNTGFNG